MSDARNVGLSVANGDYICFVDSDDYIENDCMQNVKFLIASTAYPDVVFMKRISFIEGNNVKVYSDEGFTSEINNLHGDDLYVYFSHLKKYPVSACVKAIR